ncbi:hypothetical protein [Streptomyces taklimakanensis]|uniref:glycine-rich domain-containing protein n=1 Tax=Streptomyces taklimakanensis TaxID=2569853 RepID=UPI00308464B4
MCVDGDFFEVGPDGRLTIIRGELGLRNRVIYRDPGNHVFRKADYPWLTKVFIEVQGAGGGSAGANARDGECIARPGGAGGAYANIILAASSLGATEAVVVGAGGAAGTSNGAGGAGGASSFGGVAVAQGGDGGTVFMTSGTSPDVTSGVPGASALGGTGGLTAGGGASGGAFRLNGTNGMAGAGGDSRMGQGGFPRASEGDGGVPRGRGSGAGGSLSYGEPVNGQDGADGLVIVWLYG